MSSSDCAVRCFNARCLDLLQILVLPNSTGRWDWVERRSGDPWVLPQTASYYDNSPPAHMLQLIVGRISIKCTPADHSFGRRYIHGAHIEKGVGCSGARPTFVMPPHSLRAKLILSLASNLRLGSISNCFYCVARAPTTRLHEKSGKFL